MGRRSVPRIDEATLQRIRRVLAKRGTESPTGAVRLDRIDDDSLHAHVMVLVERGEALGEVVEQDGREIVRIRGGLTDKGLQALDEFARKTRDRQEALARTAADAVARRARRLRLMTMILATALAAVALWFFLTPDP